MIDNGAANQMQEARRCKQWRHACATRGICNVSLRETLAVCFLISLAFFQLSFVPEVFAFETSNSSEQNPPEEAPAIKQKLEKEWSEYVDLAGTANPLGLDVSGGFEYTDSYRYDHTDAVSSYWQTGAGIDISPSYAQPSIAFEWMPALFLVTRLEYDGYSYFGKNGGLLSFSSGRDPFGDRELRARRGTEEAGFGSRLLFQPTIQMKVGDVVLRNQSDIAQYRFPGRGPYFLEQEYDTLLKDGDHLYANRTQALKEISTGHGGDSVLFGPYYELVHAQAADLTRQRIGILFYSEQSNKNRSVETGHFCAEIGYNLEDRNRGHEVYLLVGVGGDRVMK